MRLPQSRGILAMIVDSKTPIWQLVEHCAKRLTQSGHAPFTRGELIERVRAIRPECGNDSINPIIQGITENLRGGAPGAVGKKILYSVERGKFVLAQHRGHVEKAQVESVRAAKIKLSPSADADLGSVTIEGRQFQFVADLAPERSENGKIKEIFPQARYQNVRGLPLNKYGKGPFCKFKIPSNLSDSGVYAILVDQETKYIGECVNLSRRYNGGYGNISPRNCYRGGQETNCRINNLVFRAADSGKQVTLWFHKTSNHEALEKELRDKIALDWNKACVIAAAQ